MSAAAFRQGLADAPEDVSVRLVYADWLEEQEDVRRAEFHRRVACRKIWPAVFGDWCFWYCNPKGLVYLLPASFVMPEVMTIMGRTYVDKGLEIKKIKHLYRALECLEGAMMYTVEMAT